MADYAGKTVAEILKGKQARIKYAPLGPGSPSWGDILSLTWEEVVEKAQRGETGFRTIYKLLNTKRFDK